MSFAVSSRELVAWLGCLLCSTRCQVWNCSVVTLSTHSCRLTEPQTGRKIQASIAKLTSLHKEIARGYLGELGCKLLLHYLCMLPSSLYLSSRHLSHFATCECGFCHLHIHWCGKCCLETSNISKQNFHFCSLPWQSDDTKFTCLWAMTSLIISI